MEAVSGDATRSWPSFGVGSVADVILSMDRDDYYSGTLLGDSLSSLLEDWRDFGTRRVGVFAPEIQLLAAALYHFLTGQQTLGQEYCDLLLEGSGDRALGGGLKGLYVTLHVLWPYVQQIVQNGWPSFREWLDTLDRRAEAARIRAQMLARAAPDVNEQPLIAHESRQVQARSTQRRKIACAVLAWTGRLHLAVYFLRGGWGYTPAMTILGIKLGKTTADGGMHPGSGEDARKGRYRVLGVLLMMQVVIEAGKAISDRAAKRRSGGDETDNTVANTRIPSLPPPTRTATSAPQALGRRCSLCMAGARQPCCLPCGHMFCWSCGIGWCQERPECPLCRAPTPPQAIGSLQQYA